MGAFQGWNYTLSLREEPEGLNGLPVIYIVVFDSIDSLEMAMFRADSWIIEAGGD